MANTITGRILSITPTEMIPTSRGEQFAKRSLVIDLTRYDRYTGERQSFENTPLLEFGGNVLCIELDNYKVGDIVTISFDLQGTKYRRKTDGAETIFTRVRPYRIEHYTPQQQNAAAQAASTIYPDAQPTGTNGAPALAEEENSLPF